VIVPDVPEYVDAVPELVSVRVHRLLVFVQLTEVMETCAVEVKEPKRPKTKPAMATAAISVIAMRMTVASTGDTALLCFLLPLPCILPPCAAAVLIIVVNF
jgi:hypothetical protein